MITPFCRKLAQSKVCWGLPWVTIIACTHLVVLRVLEKNLYALLLLMCIQVLLGITTDCEMRRLKDNLLDAVICKDIFSPFDIIKDCRR